MIPRAIAKPISLYKVVKGAVYGVERSEELCGTYECAVTKSITRRGKESSADKLRESVSVLMDYSQSVITAEPKEADIGGKRYTIQSIEPFSTKAIQIEMEEI